MALYEITFLTKEETDLGVKAAIEEAGGTIQNESSLGRKRLVYPIKKETQAVYTTYVFETEPGNLTGIDRKLRLNNELLRFLLVSKSIARVKKEVSKTVKEAIAQAEKLEDTTADIETAPTVTAVTENQAVETASVVEEPAGVEAVTETTSEPAKKPRARKTAPKTEPADAAEATEEDRLKALEDKLGEILKD